MLELVLHRDAQAPGLPDRAHSRREAGAGGFKEGVLKALGSGVVVARESRSRSRRFNAKRQGRSGDDALARTLKAYSRGVRTRKTAGDFDSVPFFAKPSRGSIRNSRSPPGSAPCLATWVSPTGAQDDQQDLKLRTSGNSGGAHHIGAALLRPSKWTSEGRGNLPGAAGHLSDDFSSLVNLGSTRTQPGTGGRRDSPVRARGSNPPDPALAWQNLSSALFDAGRYRDAPKALDTIEAAGLTSSRVGLCPGDCWWRSSLADASRGRAWPSR